jgi:hypothetical protein
MAMKRQSLKLDEIDWQVLMGIAADCGCEYRGTPSWRRLFDDIASGKLSVVNRPDKRVRNFQAKLRQPMIEQRQKQQTANWTARGERDRRIKIVQTSDNSRTDFVQRSSSFRIILVRKMN